MKILLVEPDFPVATKSKNHSHFLPIGLLKIGTYHKLKGDRVKLVRGLIRCGFNPDRILITSSFTYWSKYVHEAAHFYHNAYPSAKMEIGGIYASLMPRDCKERSPFAAVYPGLYREGAAEKVGLDYSLLPEDLDYQIIHTSRGCTRRCTFCGTWRIEPEFTCVDSVLPLIKRRKLVFYDNNLLANPHIDKILGELAEYRTATGHPLRCDSQSGFDLNLLTPERAKSLKEAHFVSPRIAWDWAYKTWARVRNAVGILEEAGYKRKDIYVFMIYNYVLPYREMKEKLEACRRWGVRVIDCRYRPLDYTEDNYRPGPKPQPAREYYLHKGWRDVEVRRFRRAVRRQNIAILLGLPNGRYIQGCESRKVPVSANKKGNKHRNGGYDAAWEDAAKTIASKDFRGLQVYCRKCHRSGTLTSKWVKGTPVKPLYVCHSNGNGYFKACELEGEQAKSARAKIKIGRDDVLKLLRMGRAFVLFSGGKDSLCLLEYMRRLGDYANKEITALHVDTTAGFPEVEEYVRKVCKKLDVRLVTVRPQHDYFEIAKKWGIPGVRSRWCCETLKVAPMRRFLSTVEGPKVIFDGIRAAESNIRATYVPVWFHPAFRCISVSSIFGWSDAKVVDYIKRHNLPKSPTAELNTSAECWCGAYKCKGDFEALLEIHPDIFDKLVEVEKAQRGKYTFLFEKGEHIPLTSLKRRRTNKN